MKTKRAADAESESDFIGFRSAELAAKLRALQKANPGHRGLMTAVIVSAVSEKLQRMERGEDAGISLRVASPVPVMAPSTKGTGLHDSVVAEASAARRPARRRKNAS